MCTRVGVLDRGRLVLQDELAELQKPTGRVEVRTPDVARVRELLDGVVEQYDAERLLVRAADPAALNARLVSAGVRVTMLAPSGAGSRTSCWRRPAPARTGSARTVRAVIRVELVKLVRNRRTWVTIALIDALPTLVAVLLAVTDLGPRPGTGPAFLSAVLTDGTLFPLAALGHRAAAVPADRGGDHRR